MPTREAAGFFRARGGRPGNAADNNADRALPDTDHLVNSYEMWNHAREDQRLRRQALNQRSLIVIDRSPWRNGVVAKFERRTVIFKP
jgi:hypothetical protein